MTLEGINPDGLPTPLTYTHVIVATGRRLVFVAGQEPEMNRATSSVPVTWRSRPARCLPTSGLALAAALNR